MGRVTSQVTVSNAISPEKQITLSALVDTGAAYLCLPKAWKDRFGDFISTDVLEFETANQATITGEVCGPVRIEIEGFRPVNSEVLFIDMQPDDGVYEPLLGYIPLEQCAAAVDMLGHRLIHARKIDLK